MRILVLSDIHANLTALDAVLASVGSVDAIWQLGDVVGYGPEPDAVVGRLRDLGATGVRGNHDAAALGGAEIEYFNVDARRAVEWTRTRLAPETRRWLADLPDRQTNGAFTLVHGSPRDPTWEYLSTTTEAQANLELLDTPHCLYGHTHLPLVFRAAADGQIETIVPTDGALVQLDERRILANPGSVGQPRDGDPRASALILDLASGTLRWHRVAYDIALTQAAMRAQHLPERLVDRLVRGR